MTTDQLSKKEIEKRSKEMEEKIDAELQKVDLKTKQCKGGKTKWLGEREAAMKLTHLFMETDNMEFRCANKLGWQYVKEERCKPCKLLNEEKND